MRPLEKPFPWRCPKCRQPTVTRVAIPYSCRRKLGSRMVMVEIPTLAVPRCSNCGEIVFDIFSDEQIRVAFRTQFDAPDITLHGEQINPYENAGTLEEFIHRYKGSAMAKHLLSVDAQIALLLDATTSPASPNRFSAQELRDLALKYLKDYDEELARFPQLAEQPHWNLWMDDSRYQNALFAVLIFWPNEAEFFCGIGNAFDVKKFAESDFPTNPNEVLPVMSQRFSIPQGSIRLDRQEAVKWLGRGW